MTCFSVWNLTGIVKFLCYSSLLNADMVLISNILCMFMAALQVTFQLLTCSMFSFYVLYCCLFYSCCLLPQLSALLNVSLLFNRYTWLSFIIIVFSIEQRTLVNTNHLFVCFSVVILNLDSCLSRFPAVVRTNIPVNKKPNLVGKPSDHGEGNTDW